MTDYRGAAKDLEAEIRDLHAKVDAIVKQRIYEVAAKVSGAPVAPLRDIFIRECSSGYCRCRAIRNIIAGNDGL